MRRNNFDLLRLLAALEVVVGHIIEFFSLPVPWFLQPAYVVMRWFPGVPIFFAMSGYLLAQSLARNPDLWNYARNRALRIFPALWVNVSVTIGLLAMAGLLLQLPSSQLVAFVLAQFTIGQSWAPGAIAEYGLGAPLTPNSALWTIRMEIGFYIGLPILLLGGAWLLRTRRRVDAAIVTSALVSFAAFSLLVTPGLDESGFSVMEKLIADSPLPHVWLFLGGVLVQRFEAPIRGVLVGRLWPWLLTFLLARVSVWITYEWSYVNPEGQAPAAWALGLANLVLIMPSFAFAFSPSPTLARLKPRGDISYGIYLWHMVLVGAIVHWSLASGWTAGVIAIGGSIVAGYFSWVLIEKPALSFKRAPSVKPTLVLANEAGSFSEASTAARQGV